MNDELKSINMSDPIERAELALITKNIETLHWFVPDVEVDVRLNIVRNSLFNRDLFKKINYDEKVIKEELLKTKNVLNYNEIDKLKEELNLLNKDQKAIDSFCPLPWNHLGVMTNGNIRMCCQMIYEPYGILDINVKDISNLTDIRNLPPLKKIRREMLDGVKPDICKLCWTEENSNLKSKRIHQNLMYKNVFSLAKKYTKEDGEIDTDNIPLNYLDLRLGNKCNLACRSCGPTESNQWYEDTWKSNQTNVPFYNGKKYSLVSDNNKIIINSNDFSWPDKTNFLDQILDTYKNIDRLYFTGGEPTINIPHIQFLEKLIDEKMAKYIYLEYNSNGMAMPERLLNIWPNFKGVGIGFSIDGMGERFEYLRYPGKWKKFINTLSKLDKYVNAGNKIDIALAPTISIYNFLHMLDLYNFILFDTPKWFVKSMPIHVLEGPDYMSPKILPNYAKEKIRSKYKTWMEKIKNIKELPNMNFSRSNHIKNLAIAQMTNLLHYIDQPLPNREILLKDFYSKTDYMDNIRNQNWKETFPELDNLLK